MRHENMELAKIGVLIGTRPGIIKMSPIILELQRQDVQSLVIHTGQHYSLEMDRKIMEDVGLDEPDYQITRPESCISHAEQTAYMLTGIENVLLKEKPSVFLVCGDANTNMAGALAARKIHIKVGHVEAGLRSFDWRMPEEHNRIIIDHISEYLFAPTNLAKRHLTEDGVRGQIFVVGNTIVDATLNHVKIALTRERCQLSRFTDGNPYLVLTVHREENVDHEEVLRSIMAAIKEITEKHKIQVIFPIHPRTKKRCAEFGMEARLSNIQGLKIVRPLGYLEFLALLNDAEVVMTDSGGIQEEACILQVPCITLRESTERPETIEVGANHLAGTQRERIIEVFKSVRGRLGEKKTWLNPYGDGNASKRIVETSLSGHPKDELTSAEYEW